MQLTQDKFPKEMKQSVFSRLKHFITYQKFAKKYSVKQVHVE